jgi:hypothetical protein
MFPGNDYEDYFEAVAEGKMPLEREKVKAMLDGMERDFDSNVGEADTPAHMELMYLLMYVFFRRRVAKIIHAHQIERGWWSQPADTVPTKLLMIHSEVSEATEAVRNGNGPDDKIPAFSGAEAELADVDIRSLDLEAHEGWDVGMAIMFKTFMNRGRGHRHGGKAF